MFSLHFLCGDLGIDFGLKGELDWQARRSRLSRVPVELFVLLTLVVGPRRLLMSCFGFISRLS
jgi:hypothetical protein